MKLYNLSRFTARIAPKILTANPLKLTLLLGLRRNSENLKSLNPPAKVRQVLVKLLLLQITNLIPPLYWRVNNAKPQKFLLEPPANIPLIQKQKTARKLLNNHPELFPDNTHIMLIRRINRQ